jgi:hypothetical protein
MARKKVSLSEERDYLVRFLRETRELRELYEDEEH